MSYLSDGMQSDQGATAPKAELFVRPVIRTYRGFSGQHQAWPNPTSNAVTNTFTRVGHTVFTAVTASSAV